MDLFLWFVIGAPDGGLHDAGEVVGKELGSGLVQLRLQQVQQVPGAGAGAGTGATAGGWQVQVQVRVNVNQSPGLEIPLASWKSIPESFRLVQMLEQVAPVVPYFNPA